MVPLSEVTTSVKYRPYRRREERVFIAHIPQLIATWGTPEQSRAIAAFQADWQRVSRARRRPRASNAAYRRAIERRDTIILPHLILRAQRFQRGLYPTRALRKLLAPTPTPSGPCAPCDPDAEAFRSESPKPYAATDPNLGVPSALPFAPFPAFLSRRRSDGQTQVVTHSADANALSDTDNPFPLNLNPSFSSNRDALSTPISPPFLTGPLSLNLAPIYDTSRYSQPPIDYEPVPDASFPANPSTSPATLSFIPNEQRLDSQDFSFDWPTDTGSGLHPLIPEASPSVGISLGDQHFNSQLLNGHFFGRQLFDSRLSRDPIFDNQFTAGQVTYSGGNEPVADAPPNVGAEAVGSSATLDYALNILPLPTRPFEVTTVGREAQGSTTAYANASTACVLASHLEFLQALRSVVEMALAGRRLCRCANCAPVDRGT